jgi:hypothetical protein
MVAENIHDADIERARLIRRVDVLVRRRRNPGRVRAIDAGGCQVCENQ